MELLLALDFISISEMNGVLRKVGDSIDIVEAGTPFIIKEGIKVVQKMRREFPSLKIMADLKIMDAGEYETETAISAGADIVTILGLSDDATIKASLTKAKRYQKRIMVDMIGVSDMEKRAGEIDELGVHYICVHTAFDVQNTGRNPLDELQKVKRVVKNAKIAVAGGIRIDTIAQIINERPDIVIVGGGITGQPDMRKAALEIKRIMGK